MNNSLIELQFQFKGERDYVHGTDIFDVLEDAFEARRVRILELNFRGFARHQMTCVFTEPGTAARVSGIAVDESGGRISFWLIEREEQITERYAFGEDAIADGAVVKNKSIRNELKDGFSVIEHVVALTKRLNYILTPDVQGKWIFGQLRLKRPLPPVARGVEIIQKSMLAGRFSVQEIILDGENVGRIHFITSEL